MNSSLIVCWNIRGAVNGMHRSNLKRLIVKYRPTMVCLQETKCLHWTSPMKNSIWKEIDHGWIESSAQGLSGGLLTTWDLSVFKLESFVWHTNFILFKGKVLSTGKLFYCFNIYAPTNPELKKYLWLILQECYFQQEVDIPGLLVGDFNCVFNEEERVNCAYNKADSLLFLNFVKELELEEIPMVGAKFTWYGPACKKTKLDRILVNVTCLQVWEWKVQALNRMNSDHKPLLLCQNPLNWGPKPFKVFDWWLRDEKLVQNLIAQLENSDSTNVFSKLKGIKDFLKTWSRDAKSTLDKEIEQLELKQAKADAEETEEGVKLSIQKDLEQLYENRCSNLRQQSRIHWAEQDEVLSQMCS